MGLVIIEDSRQQKGKHERKHKWWGANGVSIIISKLAFGDYALVPPISVDTKKDIAELAMNVQQQHARFRRECINACDAGCQLVILVENTDGVASLADLAAWHESAAQFAKRRHAQQRIDGARLAKACATMSTKYGVRFEFCTPDESAKRIVDILTKESGCRNG